MAGRSLFSGKIGFLFVAIGATIGLGCLWRFPYMTAEHGGGLFILMFIALMILFGLPLLVTEFAIGRSTKLGALNAYKAMHPKFGFLGYLTLIGVFMIHSYYVVITAWIGKYALLYLTGNSAQASSPTFFAEFSASYEPVVWVILLALMLAVCVKFGLRQGLERFSKFLIPIAMALLILFAVFVFFIPGTSEGIMYYLTPNFETFNLDAPLAALGQVFYAMSVGMGIMLTIGSYTAKNINLVKTSIITAVFITITSFVAGLAIIPLSYMQTGGNPGLFGAGIVCEGMPLLLSNIPSGWLLGGLFFMLLFVAAFLANICTLETMVTALIDRFNLSRTKSIIIMTVLLIISSVIISLGYGLFDWVTFNGNNILEMFDLISGNFILPIVSLLTCILVGYYVKPSVIFKEIGLGGWKWVTKLEPVFAVFTRFVMPAFIIIVLAYGVLAMF